MQGTIWEELECTPETMQVEDNGDSPNGVDRTINFLTVETDELGTLVAMLCPKQDIKRLSSSSEKVGFF